MKKLLAVLLVVLVLISVPVAESIPVPRQVDPNSAPADPVYGQGLYLFYGAIVSALTGGNFTAAKLLLQQTSFIHIPPEILDAYNTFNGLVNTTSVDLEAINSKLANTSAYVSTGRLALARSSLQGAETNLAGVNATLAQLFGAAPQLAALTGIPSSLFLQKLHPLEGLYLADNAEADRLLKVLTGLSRLDLPSLTLTLSSRTIETGSDVAVSGRLLDSSGTPLQSRNVTVYFEGRAIGTAASGASGAFSADLPTPYFYRRNATMFASFLPSGNDTLVYAPASSVPVILNVTYASPVITVQASKTVYAGQPVWANGTLASGGRPLGGYRVTLTGFREGTTNESVATTTNPDGSFSLALTAPTSLGRGTYPLALESGANRSIGPSVKVIAVFVIKADLSVSSSAPMFALAGLPITVSGSVEVNGTGLQGAKVVDLSPSPSVDTVTSASGSFSFSVTPPVTAANGGWTYAVGVYPAQGWISSGSVTVNVFVINPLVLLFPASSLGLLAMVVRRRRQPPQALVVEPKEPPRAALEPPARPPLYGLPALYAAAVALVEAATSVMLQPQTTVREYLSLVRASAKGMQHFEYISSALESQIYGLGAGEEAEKRAGDELDALRRELES